MVPTLAREGREEKEKREGEKKGEQEFGHRFRACLKKIGASGGDTVP